METPGTRLRDFYNAELSALHGEAAEFARAHPEAARELGLACGHSSDPQVEILLQSFAFLTARLQHQLRRDEADLPNSLLAFLYPHLEAPLPSMLVAQVGVKPDGANFSKEQLLPRGRYIGASVVNEDGKPVQCRFRTCYETPLLPFDVAGISLMPCSDEDHPGAARRAHSALRVRVCAQIPGKVSEDCSHRMRFYIDRNEPQGLEVYELLARHLCGIEVHVPVDGALEVRASAPDNLRWLGFGENEAVLEPGPDTHPGYRLLQEYFAFPEKFLFFDAGNLDFSGANEHFDLLFLFDTPVDKALPLSSTVLRLNCVPLANIFSQRLDPIGHDHTEYEYRLQGDLINHRHCEVYRIEELKAIRPGASPRPILPYFALDRFMELKEQTYFYVARRARTQAPGVAGTELYLSLLDARLDMAQPTDEVVAGRALCTNRSLPERLMAGVPLYLEGPGPVNGIVAVTRPTAHHTPDQIGTRPWALVSQLALNHLSLTEGKAALAAFKDILRLHVGGKRSSGLKQVDGIRSLASRPAMRPAEHAGWRGFVRCTQVRIKLDRRCFGDSNPVLFGSVLRHFLALYANINHLAELIVNIDDNEEEAIQWQPEPGARTVL